MGMERIRKKVLVVDDNPSSADMFSSILRLEGYDVITAYSAEHALKIALEHSPHAASTDIDLKDRICGIELMRRLHKIVPGIAVCVMSGHMPEERRQKAIEEGAYAALSKPINLDHYLLTMAEGVNRSKVALN
jgi:DNA-binding NtrC family response regulator